MTVNGAVPRVDFPTPTLDGGRPMDHAATARRLYELLSAGDVDGFGPPA